MQAKHGYLADQNRCNRLKETGNDQNWPCPE